MNASVGAIMLTTAGRMALPNRTLSEFAAHLAPGFPEGPAFDDLDPAMGDAADHATTLKVIRRDLPDAEAFEPETPGLGFAVIRLRSRVPDGPVPHLEDDWSVPCRIDPGRAAAIPDGETRVVAFRNPHHDDNGLSPTAAARRGSGRSSASCPALRARSRQAAPRSTTYGPRTPSR